MTSPEVSVAPRVRKNVARRPSSHPDRSVLTYKYPCRIVGALPAWVEEYAEMMRQGWNDLAVPLKRKLREVPDSADRKIKPQIVKEFFKDVKTVRALVRNRCKGNIPSDLYEAGVVTSWQTTLGEWPERRKRAKENGKPVSFETGMPRPRYELNDYQMLVVFNTTKGNEIQFEDLRQGVNGVQILRSPDERGVNALFRVRAVKGAQLRPVALRADIDRLPPSDAFVKRVILTSKVNSWGEREWALILTCQVKKRKLRRPTGRVFGWNSIGWRLLEDAIRIGVLADNGGNFYEIRLPLLIAGHEFRREAEFFGVDYFKPLTFEDAEILQSTMDAQLERCKESLRAVYLKEKQQWPEEARQIWIGLTKMRAGGLRRLHAVLKGHLTEAELILAEWIEDHAKQSSTLRAFQQRALASKQDAFRKIAHWLAKHADQLAMTGGKLKKLAEDPEQSLAVKNSQRQRQIAGQFYLREWVAKQFAKQNPMHVDEEGNLSPARPMMIEEAYRCECSGTIQRSGKLFCVCENGHWRDQDVAAAAYMLAQLESPASTSLPPLQIPPDLHRYLRVMTASEVAVRLNAAQ